MSPSTPGMSWAMASSEHACPSVGYAGDKSGRPAFASFTLLSRSDSLVFVSLDFPPAVRTVEGLWWGEAGPALTATLRRGGCLSGSHSGSRSRNRACPGCT